MVKQAEFDYADKQYKRSKELVVRGAVSEQERDVDLARADASRAALLGAQAQAMRTQSAIDAATAEAERIAAEIKDNMLKSPIRARVQTRMAEPGEVLPAGGKVLALVDLGDVYMYVFLPTDVAGKVALGSEGRIVLDAAPEYPIRAVRVLCFAQRTIHAQNGRNRRRAPQSDLPCEAATRQRAAASTTNRS